MNRCWYCNNELTTSDSSKHFGICNKCYDEMFKSGDTIIRSFTNKIAELQKQLVDKDQRIAIILKENEELIKKHNVYSSGDEIQQDKIYAITGEALEFLISNQDKLSFCIKQLEKAKENVKNIHIEDTQYDCYCFQEATRDKCIKIIDNQIKQLKEDQI